MSRNVRRILLVVGAGFLVSGWGITRYADEQQQSDVASTGKKYEDARNRTWHGEWDDSLASKSIYAAGVLSMAVGAGLMGLSALRGDSK